MVDRDLAMLYEVETRALHQAVKRNIERFPNNFMFQIMRTFTKLRKRILRQRGIYELS